MIPSWCTASLIIAAWMTLAFGCATARTKTDEPKGESAVTLSATEPRTPHTAEIGNRIFITLPPVTAPAHNWQIAQLDSRFLQQLTRVTPGATAADGATIELVARRGGTTRVRFVLLPNQPAREVVPAAQHELVLTIE